MEELTYEEIKKQFRDLRQEYKNNPDKDALTRIFVCASRLVLALTTVSLENYPNKEMETTLKILDRFCDNVYSEMTGITIRLT